MKIGMKFSFTSWWKFPVYPPALNTSAGLWRVTPQGCDGFGGAEASVTSLTYDIAVLSLLRG